MKRSSKSTLKKLRKKYPVKKEDIEFYEDFLEKNLDEINNNNDEVLRNMFFQTFKNKEDFNKFMVSL